MTARRDPARMFGAAAQWANASIDSWAAGARGMATGENRASSSPAEWFSFMMNASTAACRVGYEWLEYVMTGRIPERVTSDEFSSAYRLPTKRTLVLQGPLLGVLPPIQTIDAARVAIVPAVLVGSVSSFHLEVDATGCRGGIYRGIVNVLGGDTPESIDVVVQVP